MLSEKLFMFLSVLLCDNNLRFQNYNIANDSLCLYLKLIFDDGRHG